jgi:hypothetical protein
LRTFFTFFFIIFIYLSTGWLLVYTPQVITGTTVGYGDVSPTSPTGRWLAVVWLPVAIMVVGGELSRVGECLFGDTQSDKLNELLNMDLSLEVTIISDSVPLVESRCKYKKAELQMILYHRFSCDSRHVSY